MNFQESFVQSVWKFQYFNRQNLATTDGQPLSIRKIGFHNFHEGPDFSESEVQIGNLKYHGNVEVHIKSSDWIAHKHEQDPKFETVILHVVWEHDLEIDRSDGTQIPTLELKGKVFLDVLRNYQRLIQSPHVILCEDSLLEIPEIIKFSMLEKSLVERLQEKCQLIEKQLELTGGDWEEVAYRWLFYSFGFKVNSGPMLELARSLPYNLLKKHAHQPAVLEALLLGQAGFLKESKKDDYSRFLQKEFEFYQQKYGLHSRDLRAEWKFMRVRPANYPTIRIAQLAALLAQRPNLISILMHEIKSLKDLQIVFSISASPYWEYHFRPGYKSRKRQSRNLTKNTIQLLAINFVIPLWYAYGQYIDDSLWKERCFDFLQLIPAESNHIIFDYEKSGWKAGNAFDTQGMIGLHHHYCQPKKCLDCKVGQQLLRPQRK
ncbi:DUF2851 family protein [Echinicola jeungdonensis]|uniref:DUF2851 family protein n=1 Tax=Echinicola jeungdonensis TaxID=709343 RepID=A0ABV5J5V1_9BACT|nr:DUF2851 family protein [Echinicola jeungdonensis]MDN3669591.1 DUF2851 family protein [Echinicola jeungdonensis]